MSRHIGAETSGGKEDISCAGNVVRDYKKTALNELEEELGITKKDLAGGLIKIGEGLRKIGSHDVEIDEYVSLIGAKLDELLSTTTFASEFSMKLRFEPAKNKNAIEYVAPDYGITEDNPYTIEGQIELTPDGKLLMAKKTLQSLYLEMSLVLKGCWLFAKKYRLWC